MILKISFWIHALRNKEASPNMDVLEVWQKMGTSANSTKGCHRKEKFIFLQLEILSGIIVFFETL